MLSALEAFGIWFWIITVKLNDKWSEIRLLQFGFSVFPFVGNDSQMTSLGECCRLLFMKI